MFDFQEELRKLPDQPGVYIMHDKTDAIIYIGKQSACANGCGSIFSRVMMRASRKNRWWSTLHGLSILLPIPSWRLWCWSAI